MTFKKYAEWLFPYTDNLGSWSDYDCEYDNSLTQQEIELRYYLYKFMISCLKYSGINKFNDLYISLKRDNCFLTEAIIVKYNNKRYLITEMDGQGTAISIELINHHRFDCYGFIDINDLLEVIIWEE